MHAAGPTSGIAFIDPAGNFLGFQPNLFDGAVTVAGTNWDFAPGSSWANTSGGVPIVTGLYGTGTVTLRSRFEGSYTLFSPGGAGTAFSYDYSVANALAATASDVVGTWSATNLSVSVSSLGALSGTTSGSDFGVCNLTGTVTQVSPGTSKNMFAVSATPSAASSGTCLLDTTRPFTGYAAITFANIGSAGSPLYVRSLTVMVRKFTPYGWFAAELVKH